MKNMQSKIEQLQCRKLRPTHPGAVLREDVLPEIGISQGEFARLLGVSRRTVNELLQEKRPVTPDLAHRLGRLLGNGPSLWLNMQQSVDMWDALHMDTSAYEHIKPIKAKAA